jgi:very-short-patch-repair endonuclease
MTTLKKVQAAPTAALGKESTFSDVQPATQVQTILHNGSQYYKANDLAKALGYSNFRKAITQNVPKEHIVHGGRLGFKNSANDAATKFLDKEGVTELVYASRIPGSIDIAKALAIPLSAKFKQHYHEMGTIKVIMDAFEGEKMLRQHWLLGYRVDLYFPELKIFVECDEKNHQGYDKEKEELRTRVLSQTGSRWVRYNPDEKDFNVIRVINQIYRLRLGM